MVTSPSDAAPTNSARRRRVPPLVLGLIALVTFGAGAALATESNPRPAKTAAVGPKDGEEQFGRFRVQCTLSHRAQVDPIVAPGPSGNPAHHMHDFFGNTSTDADSTYDTMIAAGTTCGFAPDTAAYWVPALIGPDNNYVEPDHMLIYYRNRPIEYGSTTSFPADFRMIAGGVDAYPHAYWTCDGQSDAGLATRAKSPPNCGNRDLKLQVFFPSCWDGHNIDAANHRSHVAYAYDADDNTSDDIGDDTCPPTHPVKIPQIHLRVVYPVSNGPDYHLSDGTTLAHADFWNTWHQPTLDDKTDTCLRAGKNCGELRD